MQNKNIIYGILFLILVIGGGYFIYTDIKTEQKIEEERVSRESAQRQAEESRLAEEARISNKTKCFEQGDFFVITFDKDEVGQKIIIKKKGEGENICKYDPVDAHYEINNSDPEFFKAIAANALIDEVGTGPSGRSFRLYDLKDKNLVTEKKYFEDLIIADEKLTYLGEAKTKADSKNCKEFKSITEQSLTPVLAVEKTIDLKTYLVKESKVTKCIAAQ